MNVTMTRLPREKFIAGLEWNALREVPFSHKETNMGSRFVPRCLDDRTSCCLFSAYQQRHRCSGAGLRLHRGSTEAEVGRDPDYLHGHM